MRKLRIAILHEVSYLHKPVYEYQDFSERLASIGHEVTVIDFDEAHYSGIQNSQISKTGLAKVNLITLPHHKILGLGILWAKLSFYWMFRKQLAQRRFDVALVYSVFINGANAVKLCRQFGVPVVYRVLDAYHRLRMSSIESYLLKRGEQSIYRSATLIAVTNQKMDEYVRSLVNNRNAPTIILDHGVDTSHFERLTTNEFLSKQLKIPKNALLGVFLGTTYSFSRLADIVKQLPLIRTKIPNFVLMILGSGELDIGIKDAINHLEDKSSVIQCGMIAYEQLPAYLSLAHVALNPFEINDITREIIPIKMLQYLSSALPVVCTPLPDVVKHFPNQLSGVYYSASDDLNEWIQMLIKLLSLGPDWLKIDGSRARQYVSEHYSMNATVHHLEQILVGAVG
jgi:glycosyltransferase involved in cell wall biosynthesis